MAAPQNKGAAGSLQDLNFLRKLAGQVRLNLPA